MVPAVTVMGSGMKAWPSIITSFAACFRVDAGDGVEAHPGRRPVTIPTRAITIAVKISLFLSLVAMIAPYQAAGGGRNAAIPIT